MGCVASRNGGCFCTGACQKPFPSTNPDEFAERIRDWRPGEGACDDCGKTEAECFCVEPVEPGAERFKGVFIPPAKKVQDDLSKVAVEADRDIRNPKPDEDENPCDACDCVSNRECPHVEESQYVITILQRKVDGVTVYDASYRFDYDGLDSDCDEETYIGATGLERLLNELRVSLRED